MSTKRQFQFINSGRIKNSYKKNGDLACKLSEIGEKILATNQKAWVKIAEDEFLPVIIEKVERLNSQHLLKFKNVNSADDAEIYQYSELLLEQEIVEDDENHNYCILSSKTSFNKTTLPFLVLIFPSFILILPKTTCSA